MCSITIVTISKIKKTLSITTLSHLLPLSGLPDKQPTQQIFIHPQKRSTKNIKGKNVCDNDTKEIKTKIRAPYSKCSTKYTVKPCSETSTLLLCVSLPHHGCLWAFGERRSIQLTSDMGANVVIKKQNHSKKFKRITFTAHDNYLRGRVPTSP